MYFKTKIELRKLSNVLDKMTEGVNVLINLCKMGTPQEKTHVYPGLLRQNRMFGLSENTELSVEEIHHKVLQFIDGTRN